MIRKSKAEQLSGSAKNKPAEKRRLPSPLARASAELSGREEVLLCGCTGLSLYSPDEVRINTRLGEVSVFGGSLVMRWAGEGKLLVCGKISSVVFL